MVINIESVKQNVRLSYTLTGCQGKNIDERLLPHLSPLGWEHINLTGDYIWRQNKQVEQGKFRPLRMPGEA